MSRTSAIFKRYIIQGNVSLKAGTSDSFEKHLIKIQRTGLKNIYTITNKFLIKTNNTEEKITTFSARFSLLRTQIKQMVNKIVKKYSGFTEMEPAIPVQ